MTAAAARIVEGINTLTLPERLALALRDAADITNRGSRHEAYSRAGLDFSHITLGEMDAADQAALGIELARRMERA